MGLKDPKYIQNDPIWPHNGPKRAQMTKPKWAEKSLNELKWVLMFSNFNKMFTGDANQCKTWHMLQFLKRRNVKNKEKKRFYGSFS